jgi:ADP-ribosylglycohydrolase
MDPPVAHDVRMQRALRSLEGLSVGDAFGEQLVAQPATMLRRMQRRELLPGMWPYSDDTVMAMSIVETLQHHGRIDQDWLARRFARKYQLDPTRGYGSMAHRVLADIARGDQWRQAAGAAFGGQGSMGNGAAMRAAPIGAYFAGDLVTAAAEARSSAEVTHAHAEGQAGAIAVAAAAAWAADRPSGTAGLFAAVLEVVPAGHTRDAIEAAAGLDAGTTVDHVIDRLGNGSRVLAQDTVPFALWCACHHMDDYPGALWTAVSRFGDCDTLCAIVGGIVVMHHGEGTIPEEWRRRREPLSAMLRLEADRHGGPRRPPSS